MWCTIEGGFQRETVSTCVRDALRFYLYITKKQVASLKAAMMFLLDVLEGI